MKMTKKGCASFFDNLPSAVPGKINLEMLRGLALSDTLDWNTSEAWIPKLMSNKFCTWNADSQSRRLTEILSLRLGGLAGTLDCTLFPELTSVNCSNNQLTRILINEDSKIKSLNCGSNLLRFSALPLLNGGYTYFPQKGYSNDTIPIDQIIDLSSEYLINGINTTYEWISEAGIVLPSNSIYSIENGIFRAEAALAGKTVVCHMTNQTFDKITQSYTITFTDAMPVQIYHEDDKEGLRSFLRQSAAESGKLNLEMLGLAASDTLGWETSEAWIEKLKTLVATYSYCSWNNQQPKRLTNLTLPSGVGRNNILAGILDCTLFTELVGLTCYDNQLTQVIADKDSKIRSINCRNNLLRFSTLPLLNPAYVACTYFPQNEFLKDTISVEQVIDLSSEYQFNGINTVYEWVSAGGRQMRRSEGEL